MRLWQIFFVAAALTSTRMGAEPCVHLRGDYERLVHRVDGSLGWSDRYRFDAWVGSSGWLIKVLFDVRDAHYEVTGFDGAAVFSFLDQKTRPLDGYDPRSPRVPVGPVAAGSIIEADFPAGSSFATNLVWFAFCSDKAYSDRPVDRHVVAPWSTPRLGALGSCVLARFHNYSDAGLPATVEFILDAEARANSQSERWVDLQTLVPDELARLAAIPDGSVLGRYTTQKNETALGRVWPAAVRLEQPFENGSTATPRVEHLLTISSIETASLPDYFPFLPEKRIVGVRDHRLQDRSLGIDPVYYTLDDGKWPTTPPRIVREKFQSKRAAALAFRGSADEHPTPWGIVIAGVVVIVSVAGAAAYRLRRS